MRPIKNNIIVEPIEYAQSEAGLYIKAETTEKLTAKVFSVGEGTRMNPMTVKVGDIVQYRSGVGEIMSINYEGRKLLHLSESHVIAIL